MSKKVILLLIAASVFFGVGQGLAADLAKVLKDAEARYARFEQDVKDMTILQEMKMITPNGDLNQDVKMFKKGKKFRMEFAVQMPQTQDVPQGMQEMETFVVNDGSDIWMISPFMGKKKLSSKEGGQYQIQENWWESISDKAEIVGDEDVSGRRCYVLTVKEGSKSPFTKMWLEKKNLVLIKAENKRSGTENIMWVNSDFRKIKGDWEMPYKTEMYMDGKLTSTAVVKSLEINKGLQEDLFDPNKIEVKGFNMEEMMKKMMGQQQK